MPRYADAGQLEIWYDRIDVDELLGYSKPRTAAVRLGTSSASGRAKRTSRGAVAKLTDERRRSSRRILEDPPGPHRRPRPVAVVERCSRGYRDTLPRGPPPPARPVRTSSTSVRQVVGVGSVGMRVYLLLLEGRGGDDPLFLQVKQAGPSVYERHLGAERLPEPRPAGGRRASACIQSATDIFVGWTQFAGMDFYVRQFRDMKMIPDGRLIAPRLAEFATACGSVLARPTRGPATRSRSPRTSARAAVRRGARAVRHRYADRTEADHSRSRPP